MVSQTPQLTMKFNLWPYNLNLVSNSKITDWAWSACYFSHSYFHYFSKIVAKLLENVTKLFGNVAKLLDYCCKIGGKLLQNCWKIVAKLFENVLWYLQSNVWFVLWSNFNNQIKKYWAGLNPTNKNFQLWKFFCKNQKIVMPPNLSQKSEKLFWRCFVSAN